MGGTVETPVSVAASAAGDEKRRGPAMSPTMRAYFATIHAEVERCYAAAKAARAKGLDPVLDVEILPAEDLAARVEAQVGVTGVAEDVRRVSAEIGNRELVSLEVARRVAAGRYGKFKNREEAVDKAVRTGLSILTEGVLVAPLEGIAEVKIGRNDDGSDYVDLYFAGPIRAAGGTAQGMSVLIADVVRRELGIGAYQATDKELERYKEEVPAYRQAANLQYTPGPTEIEAIVTQCPVCINGEGTERVEVAGNRDLPRVPTNQLRGGAMLVLCEGMCLKAPKLQKHVAKLGLEGWDFLGLLAQKAASKSGAEEQVAPGGLAPVPPSNKYIRDLIAGRPVFGHPSRAGGFRLRYGRARTAGLASTAVHPAVMPLLDDFLAVGTQMKVERPGKGTIGTPCAAVDPPIVELRGGDVIALHSVSEVHAARPFLSSILDLGDLLVPFGEFSENNHVLPRSPWVTDWFQVLVQAHVAEHGWPDGLPGAASVLADDRSGALAARDAFQVAEATGLPLAPSHTLLWHDLSVDEVQRLADLLAARRAELRWGPAAPARERDGCPDPRAEGDTLTLPTDAAAKALLRKLTVLHRDLGPAGLELIHGAYALLRGVGLDVGDGGVIVETPRRAKVADVDVATLDAAYPTNDFVSRLSGVTVPPRAPFRIGSRMGRPEKADARRMKPPPHVLFPVGPTAGAQRLVGDAVATGSGKIRVEVGKRRCPSCRLDTYRTFCDDCGGHTQIAGEPEEAVIDLAGEMRRAVERLGLSRPPKKIKAVVGMMSATKTPEPLEKGLLRALHGVFTFKDGTVRFDMSDGPLTHFRPDEVGVPVDKLVALGYTHDSDGAPLERADQMLELRVQDIVVPHACGEYLLKCARFVDDLLERFYHLPRFYNAETRDDLVGHLVGGLAPHTSGAIAARIIGFTPSQVGWGHPYFHAGKRRNCDGDEDAVFLLMDGLLNFSKTFVPDRRGGLMDLPLVLTTRLDPAEIDKEAHNLDVLGAYPLAFFDATTRHAHPKEVEGVMGLVGGRIGTPGQYEGFGYTHETPDISEGVLVSSYKTIPDMMAKLEAQLDLATKIRAVDMKDVASRVIGSHFMPDLIGNLKAFSKQKVRCPLCNKKYRRYPLAGRCLTEGCKGKLTLTVHEGSVRKYLQPAIEISRKYDVSHYTLQRILLAERAIESLFNNDKVRRARLEDFLTGEDTGA